MKKMIIELVTEQHFIEGNCFHAFLHFGEGKHRVTIPLATAVPNDDYFKLTETLGGLKWRLESLGNTVDTRVKEIPDPNFDNGDEAAECYEMEQEYKRMKGADDECSD